MSDVAGGIPDAPNDGNQYARGNLAWERHEVNKAADVDTTGLATGKVLKWNGLTSKWTPNDDPQEFQKRQLTLLVMLGKTERGSSLPM